MTNPATNLHALKSAMPTVFGPLLAGVDVFDHEPPEKPNRVVWFGSAEISQQELVQPSTAVGSKQEEIRLHGFVEVNASGYSEADGRADATAYLAAMNDYVRANPTLGGVAGIQYAALLVTGFDAFPEAEGYAVELRFDVYCFGTV